MKRLFRIFRKIKNQPFQNIGIILFISILYIINLRFQIFAFVYPTFNAVGLGLFFLTPFLLIFNGLFFRQWWQKILNLAIFLLPSFLSIWIFTNLSILFLYISVYQPEQEINLKSSTIAVYKNIDWIDTQRGFILKQEKLIFPGIKIIKPIYEDKNLYLDRIEKSPRESQNKVTIELIYFDSVKGQQKESKELKIKNHVYF